MGHWGKGIGTDEAKLGGKRGRGDGLQYQMSGVSGMVGVLVSTVFVCLCIICLGKGTCSSDPQHVDLWYLSVQIISLTFRVCNNARVEPHNPTTTDSIYLFSFTVTILHHSMRIKGLVNFPFPVGESFCWLWLIKQVVSFGIDTTFERSGP